MSLVHSFFQSFELNSNFVSKEEVTLSSESSRDEIISIVLEKYLPISLKIALNLSALTNLKPKHLVDQSKETKEDTPDKDSFWQDTDSNPSCESILYDPPSGALESLFNVETPKSETNDKVRNFTKF